ncbi:HalOD1 output domain-containing protein [Halostella litorea]|uniref:HalOD1 output domain-containing protein n=1 Tax=Halostella litorea TaxID=2528831 RepID=UPI001092A317|nr:HalOD1 output domain-containing protein [Halostella litorea]
MSDTNQTDTTADPRPYSVVHDWDADDSLAATVVSAVAAVRNVEPTAVEPLNETVDPDALNAIFDDRHNGGDRSGPTLSFRLNGCDVTVHADGRVVVKPPEETDL